MKTRKNLRRILAIVCILLSLWFMLPLVLGILHVGMIYPALLLWLFAVLLWFWEGIKPILLRHRVWTSLVSALLCVVLIMVLVPVGLIFGAAANNAPPADATVIVLGCQVIGDRPSLILADRCDKGIAYLNAHPDARCIATGGLGNVATITEAQAIFDYMTEKGIDPSRIYLEEQATNTSENLTYSAAIIEEEGLSKTVAVVSDTFHQWRAAYFAGQNGLNAYAVGCPTNWSMAPGYWAREVAAVYKALLLGY